MFSNIWKSSCRMRIGSMKNSGFNDGAQLCVTQRIVGSKRNAEI
jgi:hypothetical protein